MIPQHQSWWNARIGELVRDHPDMGHLYHTDPDFHTAVDMLASFCHLANTATYEVTGNGITTTLQVKPWLEAMLTHLHNDHRRRIAHRKQLVDTMIHPELLHP